MILIKNAVIVDENMKQKTDLLISEDKIKLIGKEQIDRFLEQNELKQINTIEAEGKYLLSSFVDMHFHLRNPGFSNKQTYEEAFRAATKGGYTTLVCMANTNPVADCKEVIDLVKENTKNFPINIIQIAAVTKGLAGKELVDFEQLIKEVKIFSDDGKNVDSPALLKEALKKSRDMKFMILDHDEPETEMVKRNLELVRETGGRMHFCHISRKESLIAIIEGKKENLDISVEIAPHHIFSYGLDYRVNPPIAEKEDVEFIIESIKNGYVDSIGTDHAPHTEEDKANGAPGIANIETAYSMVRKVFYENDIDMNILVKLMSNSPARMLGLNSNIIEGNEANLVIVNDESYKIDKNKFETRSKNTPYHGWDVLGKIEYTIAKGEIIYDNARA
ncbi:MAG: dihydroorotase [Proteocatella sp.]